MSEKTRQQFKEFLESIGHASVHEAAKARHLGGATIKKLSDGTLPSNYPGLGKLAESFGVSVERLAPFAKGKALNARRLAFTAGAIKRLGVSRTRNGNGHPTRAARGPQLKVLRKMPVEDREALRTLTNTANTCAMKGLREITVPTQMLLTFLRDYYVAKGVPGNVVVDAIFEKLFD